VESVLEQKKNRRSEEATCIDGTKFGVKVYVGFSRQLSLPICAAVSLGPRKLNKLNKEWNKTLYNCVVFARLLQNINTKNCSLSIVLTATDQKPQKSLKR